MSNVYEEINFSLCELNKTKNGIKYEVCLESPMDLGWYENVVFVVKKGNDLLYFPMVHQKNENNSVFFKTEVELETRAIYHYYFTCFINGQFRYIKKGKRLEEYAISLEDMSKISVNFDAPDWAKGAIMYHIFVDRYRKGRSEELPNMPRRTVHKDWNEEMVIGPDSNGIWNADFYGGDLKGILDTLDYIKSFGVTVLYLSPVVWSQSNHRYDTADYMNVDPYAGCNENLRSLCDAAHRKGMRVVLDAVFNHTGNDSKYFNEYGSFPNEGAFQSTDSEYSKFYRKYYENGQVKYDYWWGMTNLPVCDGNSYEWKKFITGEGGVIDHWFSLGIDGLRLDVADELTDEFIELIRKAVKRNRPDGFILGEVWKNPMRMGRGYIETGKGMDSVMNYSLVDALIRYFKYGDVDKLAYIIKDIMSEYPKDTINTLMNFTSTHDITRAINLFATYDFQEYGEWGWDIDYSYLEYCCDVLERCYNYHLDLEQSKLEWCREFYLEPEQYQYGKNVYEAYVFALAFMPGIFSIFYGDEVGLQGMGNLANRKPYPWGHEDKDLLEFFRYIGKMRSKEAFLKEAELNILDITKDYFMFERLGEEDKMLVTVNRTGEDKRFAIPGEYEKNNSGIYTLKKSLPGHLNPYGAIAVKGRY